MKHFNVLPIIGALAATALLLVTRPWDDGATSRDAQPDVPTPGNELPFVPAEQPVAADQADPALSTDPVDSMLAPESEMVMGIRVRKDRGCAVSRHYIDLGNGTVTEAYSCVREEIVAGDHDQYGNAVLETLAYSEAWAASALGKRLVQKDPARARTLILRALALEPQNMEPAAWLASQAYSLRGGSVEARAATAESYVLTRVMRELGADVRVEWIIDDLRNGGLDGAAIAALDGRVANDLRSIRNVQLEVIGTTTIREDLL